jgi:hypothetical protein
LRRVDRLGDSLPDALLDAATVWLLAGVCRARQPFVDSFQCVLRRLRLDLAGGRPDGIRLADGDPVQAFLLGQRPAGRRFECGDDDVVLELFPRLIGL